MAEFTGFVLKSGELCNHYEDPEENARVNTAVKNLGFTGKDVACIESYGIVCELEDLRQIKSALQNAEIKTIEEALPLYLEYKNNPPQPEPEPETKETKAVNLMMKAMAPKNINDAETMGFGVDDIIVISVFYDEWKAGKFKEGDITKKDDWVWECKIEHDSTVTVDWIPGQAPTVWCDYHGKSPETAQPYRMDGGHNPYMKEEYMIYINGKIYRCKEDTTTWTPEEQPQRWEEFIKG